jgi:predicted enzyme related to lactoylglutathione lyase
MSDIRGRFIWYEALTNDVYAAVAFYTKVAGWGIQTWNDLGTPYHMFTVGDRPIGGVMQLPPDAEAPPHWLGYIGTPDIQATTARAEALGAKILVRCMEIPTVGTMSVLQDPQGAYIAAYTPASEMPPAAKGVGDIGWHEIATTDVNACFAFYGDLFGWTKLAAHDMGPMGFYYEYGIGTEPFGGIYEKPASMPAPPHFMYYIGVADLEGTIARVKEHGGTVVMGPHEVPGGDRIAMCLDPQGAGFALHWKHA